MPDKPVVRTERRDAIAVILIDNPPVNSLSLDVFRELGDAMDAAIMDKNIHGIVLTGENKNFSAGFDLSTVETFSGPEQLREGNPRVYRMLEAMEDSPKPIVAALKGSALGGGLEVALACHYRLADESASIGLPEVQVGLLPGGGGTQRLPRIVGLQEGLTMICGGETIRAEKAAKIGLIDKLVTGGSLTEEAIAFAVEKSKPGTKHPKSRERKDQLPNFVMAAGIFMFAKNQVASKAGKMIAPLKALEAVEVGVKEGYSKGLAKELDNFIELAFGEQARAMIHFFFAMRATTRIPELKGHEAEAKPIQKVGVIGGGTMGRDIAFVNLLGGKSVTLLEANQERLDAAIETIKGHFDRRVERKKMKPEKMQEAFGRLSGTLSYDAFRDVDLVIEAVFEKMDVKKEVFQNLNKVVRPDTIVASNTSTLPIGELATVIDHPERVIGLHFFSPARVMPLLEEIKADNTSPATIVTCLNLAKDIKKTPVLVGDCYGFLTNRIAMSYGSEANAILEEGASVEQIDKALVEFGLPMGPFTMGDMAGNDIGYHAAPGMQAAYPDRSRSMPSFAKKMFDAGRHGQKAGKGFYLYKKGSSTGSHDPEMDKILEESRKEAGITPRKDITDQEIVERIIYTWVNAAALCLQEGIALKPGDVDVATVMGFGFPPWRGGLMYYASQVGYGKIVAALDGYAKKYGKIYEPAQWLRDRAAEGK